MKHLRLKIYGNVQGVGFRYAAQKEAGKLGVTGFARNEPDDSVYIEAEGKEEALKHFLAWCHKGPWFAKVTQVEEEWGDALKGFKGFEVR
jgi:acylphosphatase